MTLSNRFAMFNSLPQTNIQLSFSTKVLKKTSSLSGQATMTNAGVVTIGTLNQNTTGTSATVTGASQANITSVGTLTGLTLSGAITSSGSIQGTQVDITAQGELRLQDASGGEYVGFKAPATVTNYTLTMPPATGATGEVLKMSASANVLEWGSAGGGATIVHTYTNTTNTAYLGTASSFGTVGADDRDIYIKMIDANNEGVFTKIWKNGGAVEVQIA